MKITGRVAALALLLFLVPTLFLLNVRQSYRYRRLQREILAVQDEHTEILEQNKRLVAGIATLRSPERIRALALEELGLAPLDPDRIRRIEIQRGTSGP